MDMLVEDFKSNHGGYVFGATDEGGKTIVDFALVYNFSIANILFKKKNEYFITYKNRYSKTQIDYFLIRKIDHLDCRYYKIILNQSLCTQHRLLVLNFKIKGQSMKNIIYRYSRFRWWHLKYIRE